MSIFIDNANRYIFNLLNYDLVRSRVKYEIITRIFFTDRFVLKRCNVPSAIFSPTFLSNASSFFSFPTVCLDSTHLFVSSIFSPFRAHWKYLIMSFFPHVQRPKERLLCSDSVVVAHWTVVGDFLTQNVDIGEKVRSLRVAKVCDHVMFIIISETDVCSSFSRSGKGAWITPGWPCLRILLSRNRNYDFFKNIYVMSMHRLDNSCTCIMNRLRCL